MYKNKQPVAALVILCTTVQLIFSEHVPVVNSGIVSLTKILLHDETGFGAHSKQKIVSAETKNLQHDLDTRKIVDFFSCTTVVGNYFFNAALACPIGSHDPHTILKHRQEAIKLLVERPDLKKEVDTLLQQAKNAEEVVIELMSEGSRKRFCPELAYLEQYDQKSDFLYPIQNFLITDPRARMGLTLYKLLSAGASLYVTHTIFSNMYDYYICYNTLDDWKTFCAVMYTAMDLYNGYLVYADYASAAEKRLKINALSQLVMIAKRIEKLAETHMIKLEFKLSDVNDTQAYDLIHALENSRYTDKDRFFFIFPLVHSFMYRIYQEEKYLAGLLSPIAEMDVYNACANKIIACADTPHKFCFVTFLERDASIITAQAFWNLLVTNPVVNTLSEEKNIILTGPNAGGKTTAIRAILQNILLAQTLGIAAAEVFQITKCDVIYSYLNISDDISAGLSLFASEVKRAQEIIQKIKSLEPHQKFFFALDELFTGTAAAEGEECAYEFVKRISEFSGVQFIYSTHFTQVKNLGTGSKACVNYKVDPPIKNADNKLVYPFTLSKGASTSNVALDLAREANLFA